MHLPVAFIHTQGDVNLPQSCPPTADGARATRPSARSQAPNNSFDEQVVDLDSTTATMQLSSSTSVDGATRSAGRGAARGDARGRRTGRPVRRSGRALGYLAARRSSASADADRRRGDHQPQHAVVRVRRPDVDRIGVDSNGYLIVGGGSSRGQRVLQPAGGPDPARPNNVLAPFWTDLDGTGAPGIFVGVLTDGVNSWLVIEYQVNVFGTTDLRTFQVWIGINGVEDITYEYAANQTDPAGQDFLVGAENLLGDGDMEAVLPTTGPPGDQHSVRTGRLRLLHGVRRRPAPRRGPSHQHHAERRRPRHDGRPHRRDDPAGTAGSEGRLTAQALLGISGSRTWRSRAVSLRRTAPWDSRRGTAGRPRGTRSGGPPLRGSPARRPRCAAGTACPAAGSRGCCRPGDGASVDDDHGVLGDAEPRRQVGDRGDDDRHRRIDGEAGRRGRRRDPG